jgi:hypothetical protein
MAPDQIHEVALGRAFATLEADGVTARDSLLAATAVERWGLAPAWPLAIARAFMSMGAPAGVRSLSPRSCSAPEVRAAMESVSS